jgi:caa(3)-type oxidase subunit IV
VRDKEKARQRQNLFVMVGIALLTVAEFWLAINLDDPAVPVLIIALIKSGLIVQYFMHIYRLWREEDHS